MSMSSWLGGNHGEYIDVTGNDDIWVEVPRTNPFWKEEKGALEKLIYDKLLDQNNVSIVAYKKLIMILSDSLQGKWIHNIQDEQLRNRYDGQPDTY